MNTKLLKKFVQENVKLVVRNAKNRGEYVYYGKIIDVSDDCIIFEDAKMRRVIDSSIIVEVSMPRY